MLAQKCSNRSSQLCVMKQAAGWVTVAAAMFAQQILPRDISSYITIKQTVTSLAHALAMPTVAMEQRMSEMSLIASRMLMPLVQCSMS